MTKQEAIKQLEEITKKMEGTSLRFFYLVYDKDEPITEPDEYGGYGCGACCIEIILSSAHEFQHLNEGAALKVVKGIH